MNPRLSADPRVLVQQMISDLDGLQATPPKEKDRVRETVRRLVQLTKAGRALARHHLKEVTIATAARTRCLDYLKLFVKEPVSGEELGVVAGIREFPRRIRELRVEFGYHISTGLSREDLKPDEYVLESTEPDAREAQKWQTANRIRKQEGSAESRILELLKAYVGQVLTGEELYYVAKIPTWRRRTGQLRTERGWRVATRLTGRPDLKTSEYVLESLDQLPPHDREIPDEVYSAVLERDKYCCQRCTWTPSRRVAGDRKQFIEVHHIEHHQAGGTNNAENLVTLCNVCHDSAHRLKLNPQSLRKWLENAGA